MKNIVEIKDLTFKYNDLYIFKNFNLSIKESTFLTIMGPSSCGKTTLGKIIGEKGIYINNKININTNVKTYLDNNIDICKKLKIEHLLDLNTTHLSSSEIALANIAYALIKKSNIIVIDNIISILEKKESIRILKILKKINKEKNITIINITSNVEETLYGDELLILNSNQIVLYDKTIEVLKEEKILKNNNIELPFMVSLSNKLKYYDLLDTIILDIDKMVNKLWI